MSFPLKSINYKTMLTKLFPDAMETYIYEKLTLIQKIGPAQFVTHLDAGNKIKWAKQIEDLHLKELRDLLEAQDWENKPNPKT